MIERINAQPDAIPQHAKWDSEKKCLLVEKTERFPGNISQLMALIGQGDLSVEESSGDQIELSSSVLISAESEADARECVPPTIHNPIVLSGALIINVHEITPPPPKQRRVNYLTNVTGKVVQFGGVNADGTPVGIWIDGKRVDLVPQTPVTVTRRTVLRISRNHQLTKAELVVYAEQLNMGSFEESFNVKRTGNEIEANLKDTTS